MLSRRSPHCTPLIHWSSSTVDWSVLQAGGWAARLRALVLLTGPQAQLSWRAKIQNSKQNEKLSIRHRKLQTPPTDFLEAYLAFTRTMSQSVRPVNRTYSRQVVGKDSRKPIRKFLTTISSEPAAALNVRRFDVLYFIRHIQLSPCVVKWCQCEDQHS